jgi:hypothetical protein
VVMSQGVSISHAVRPEREWIVRESHRHIGASA